MQLFKHQRLHLRVGDAIVLPLEISLQQKHLELFGADNNKLFNDFVFCVQENLGTLISLKDAVQQSVSKRINVQQQMPIFEGKSFVFAFCFRPTSPEYFMLTPRSEPLTASSSTLTSSDRKDKPTSTSNSNRKPTKSAISAPAFSSLRVAHHTLILHVAPSKGELNVAFDASKPISAYFTKEKKKKSTSSAKSTSSSSTAKATSSAKSTSSSKSTSSAKSTSSSNLSKSTSSSSVPKPTSSSCATKSTPSSSVPKATSSLSAGKSTAAASGKRKSSPCSSSSLADSPSAAISDEADNTSSATSVSKAPQDAQGLLPTAKLNPTTTEPNIETAAALSTVKRRRRS